MSCSVIPNCAVDVTAVFAFLVLHNLVTSLGICSGE